MAIHIFVHSRPPTRITDRREVILVAKRRHPMLEVVVIKLKLGTIRPKFYEINRQKLPLKVGYV
jgi:hypothetical protein